jgi:hypothetical protein
MGIGRPLKNQPAKGILGVIQWHDEIPIETVEMFASSKLATPIESARIIKEMCDKQGVKRMLYVYAGRHEKNILIASTASGWRAWTLSNDWPISSRWIGDTGELELANEDTLNRARRHGWPE